MKHLILLLGLCCTLTIVAQRPSRVPAFPGEIEKIQPNGDTLYIYLRGNEHHHFAMTTDGWMIETNKKGWLCYAVTHKDSTKPSLRKAHNKNARSTCETKWLNRRGIRKITNEVQLQ